jgi:hypothetical protein
MLWKKCKVEKVRFALAIAYCGSYFYFFLELCQKCDLSNFKKSIFSEDC